MFTFEPTRPVAEAGDEPEKGATYKSDAIFYAPSRNKLGRMVIYVVRFGDTGNVLAYDSFEAVAQALQNTPVLEADEFAVVLLQAEDFVEDILVAARVVARLDLLGCSPEHLAKIHDGPEDDARAEKQKSAGRRAATFGTMGLRTLTSLA